MPQTSPLLRLEPEELSSDGRGEHLGFPARKLKHRGTRDHLQCEIPQERAFDPTRRNSWL